MQKRYVLDLCKKYNIETKGITFKIQRSEKLIKLDYFCVTDPDIVGRIVLFPNAFIDEEQLIRTVLHEKCHVKQLRKYGKNMFRVICLRLKRKRIDLRTYFIIFLKGGLICEVAKKY